VKQLLRNIYPGKYILLILAIVFFALSFIFNKLYNNRASVQLEVKKLESYLKEHHDDFAEFLRDSARIDRLMNNQSDKDEFFSITGKPYSTFLYKVNEFGETEMVFWSQQLITPPPDVRSALDGEYFRKLSNGYYYIIKETLSPQIETYAMILVRSEFFIPTDYLPQKFLYSKAAEKKVLISKVPTEFPVKSPTGATLFYLNRKASGIVPFNNTLTISLRLGALLMLFLFCQLFADSVVRKHGAWRGIGMLAILLLLMRLAMYYFPAFLNLRQFELFNPVHYGSNLVQRSLGDLLINSGFFCWVVLFAWSKLHNRANLAERFSPGLRWAAGTISLVLLILSTFLLASVIRSLVADSKISFDVTDFFSLNAFTVVGFVVLASLSLSYYYLSQLLFRLIFPLFQGRKFFIYFAIAFAGLLYLTTRSGRPEVLFFIPVLIWLLVYTWLINRQGVIFHRIRINIASILSWITVFSISIAAIMLSEINKVEWEKRKRMAEKIALQTDPSSERLMSIAIKYLDNDFLLDNFYRFSDEVKGKEFRDSIITENYSGYLNKYDSRLYVYDSLGNALYNEDLTSYESLNTILEVQAKPTTIDGLYYYEASYDKFNFITRRDVIDTNFRKVGYFFIVSNPKTYSREALFPELFRQFDKNVEPESSPIYANAVYINDSLISPPGNYPFATSLEPDERPIQEFETRIKGDFSELWYKASTQKTIVLARKKDTFIEAITLFSYIFCSFLFLVAFVQLLSFVLKAINQRTELRKLLQLNIRSQVHGTIIFISVFSFLIIGAATISFFITRYNRNNSDKLSRTMKIMVNEMEKKLSDHNTFDDVIKLYDSVSNFSLQQLVDEVADIHGVDVNVYDLEGNLQMSSEANVYTKGVLGKKIHPEAFFYLDRLRHIQHAQEERIGNFSYLSIYSPVRDESRRVYAYINIPYFTSKPELQQEISNFLVTIINLNAFIFLIAGLIALLITNRITRSFALISDKMKEVNLGKHNDEIAWNRNDEIGELVKEYNKMVAKLGESAEALAKSEREGAWREMARQVAHEIKNPLTPMKLSIQYLQKAIHNNQTNVKELSANVANTLVEQIDHLSKIAADFSQFANIGYTQVESFDLHDVLGSLKELYQADPNIELNWYQVNGRVLMNADKTQMNRLFTNLLANAVQACREGENCHITIAEKRDENRITVSIKDNGEGIPLEMQDKIFVPNFTTKSSGTGLGLAMCKGIVEQAHGKIWFDTDLGRGTTFYVELPLAEGS
jgi:two-component system nitrogen regulation sensor histidine kinase NtrY